jgi:hypothetical protein
MLTQAQQETTIQDSLSIGSTLKQNIVEKLPAINTQVKLSINKKRYFSSSFLDGFNTQYDFKCSQNKIY